MGVFIAPCRNPTLRECEDETHSRNGVLGVKLQSLIIGVKTPRIGVFFISSKMGSHGPFGHLHHKLWQKEKGQESNWQFDSWPLKVGNQPDPGACRWSATHRWKALEESYEFASNLIPIRSLSKKLWVHKVIGVQTETVSGLLFGSPKTKSHSDVGAAERHRKYYMGEGGGFPRIWAVVSLVIPKLLVACPSTKGVPKSELTILLVGLMQVWVSK
jgi:hypothetical protein